MNKNKMTKKEYWQNCSLFDFDILKEPTLNNNSRIFETEKQLKEFLISNERSSYLVENMWDMLKKDLIDDEQIIRSYTRPVRAYND